MLKIHLMRSSLDFFAEIPDPRRSQGLRHRLTTISAIAAGAVLCGMRGRRAVSDWAVSLGGKVWEPFRCRREHECSVGRCQDAIRNVLMRIAPREILWALQRRQSPIMSVIGR